MPRSFLLGTSVLALAGVVAFLSVRRAPTGVGVTVLAAPSMAGTGRAWAVISAFDISQGRTVPFSVTSVEVLGQGVPFSVEGDTPSLLSFSVPMEPGRFRTVVRGKSDAGPGEVTFEAEVSGPEGTRSGSPVEAAWPVRGFCGQRQVWLLPASGRPPAGREEPLLVLVGGEVGQDAHVALSGPGLSVQAPLLPWGGAIFSVQMPSLPTAMRLAIRDLPGGRHCEADLLLAAPASSVAIRDLSVEKPGVAIVNATSRTGGPVYVFVAWASPDGPGPVVGAAASRGGQARIPLPGTGVFQVHVTGNPMDLAGADAMLQNGPIGQGWEGQWGPIPPEGRDTAMPFILAARAASMPIALTRVASTTAEVQRQMAAVGARRRVAALILIGGALGVQVLWALWVVLRGRRQAYDPEAPTPRDFFSPIALALVLLGAISAIVYLLASL